MFIDVAKIEVKAGDGGNGAISFHREKYVAAGGPDGGDGGRGGDVIFVPDTGLSTLLDFQYKKKYHAPLGENGGTKKCTGKDGADLFIRVPTGTLLKEARSGAIIHDMSDGKPFTVAKGGKGGFGNARFATPTRQVPRFAKPGFKGEEFSLILELKLLADVGLVGFPNVGKSTLISVVSAARPKIANYHFTTLIPNLGVVQGEEGKSFVIADIPGIIEGASCGAGLGHDFLRHIDRCRLLLHIVDVSGFEGRDPVEDFETINRELKSYSEELSKRPQIVVANKCDIMDGEDNLEKLREHVKTLGYEFFAISAATRSGVTELMNHVMEKIDKIPPVSVFAPEYVPPEETGERETEIYLEDGMYIVEGKWLENLIDTINFDDRESLQYFQRVINKSGVHDMLIEKGCKDGDTVVVSGVAFDFVV